MTLLSSRLFFCVTVLALQAHVHVLQLDCGGTLFALLFTLASCMVSYERKSFHCADQGHLCPLLSAFVVCAGLAAAFAAPHMAPQ